jgi:hypothetical protein
MNNPFFIVGVISVLFGVFCSIVMVSYISERGVKINWFLLRLFLPKYVNMYKRMTTEENGKPGYWYYIFVTCMIGGLILVIIGLILKNA